MQPLAIVYKSSLSQSLSQSSLSQLHIAMALSKNVKTNLDGFKAEKNGRNVVASYEDHLGNKKRTVTIDRIHRWVMPPRQDNMFHPSPMIRRLDWIAGHYENAAAYQWWRCPIIQDKSGNWLIFSEEAVDNMGKYDDPKLNGLWQLAYWDGSGFVMWKDLPVIFMPNARTFIPLISPAATERELEQFSLSRFGCVYTLKWARNISSQISVLGEAVTWVPRLNGLAIHSLSHFPNSELYRKCDLVEVVNPDYKKDPFWTAMGLPDEA